MVHAQVINPYKDSVMAFDGYTVINNTTQLELGREVSISEILVDINFWDLMNNSNVSVGPIKMTYHETVDFWTVDVADVMGRLADGLADMHKYVGRVMEASPAPNSMRAFKILEFSIYHDDLENTLFSLPYEIVIGIGIAKFQWYDNLIDKNVLYIADAYEGGVGTTYATHPSRVTHRGPITKNLS